MEKKAFAKINLCLDVTGKLENGYHLVKMIMQTVGIYDTLTFERTSGEIQITVEGAELPLGADNLIYKSVRLVRETFGIAGGARVHLVKRIPVAAGMAGGSTDAASTLKAMNELYELGLSEQELMDLGVKLGADIPYCIMGGTALAEGIGEKLTRLPDMPETTLLVVKPDAFVSTKDVYQKLDAMKEMAHPDVDGMERAIRGGELTGVIKRLGNVLEPVTVEMVPKIRLIEERMRRGGALGCLMSGSGPSVFGLFEGEEKARQVLKELQEADLVCQGFVTEPVRA